MLTTFSCPWWGQANFHSLDQQLLTLTHSGHFIKYDHSFSLCGSGGWILNLSFCVDLVLIRLHSTFSRLLTFCGSVPLWAVLCPFVCLVSILSVLLVRASERPVSQPCAHHVCCRHCLLGGCLTFAFLWCFFLYLQILNEKKLYLLTLSFMASGFWFMHRKVSLFKYYKNTYTCFFYYFCGFIFTSNCTFSENYSRAV